MLVNIVYRTDLATPHPNQTGIYKAFGKHHFAAHATLLVNARGLLMIHYADLSPPHIADFIGYYKF